MHPAPAGRTMSPQGAARCLGGTTRVIAEDGNNFRPFRQCSLIHKDHDRQGADRGDKVGLRPIKVDERVGNFYIVTEGLKAGERVVVMPRLGTVSPWASKATEIALHCGAPVARVERVTEFHLRTKAGLDDVVAFIETRGMLLAS